MNSLKKISPPPNTQEDEPAQNPADAVQPPPPAAGDSFSVLFPVTAKLMLKQDSSHPDAPPHKANVGGLAELLKAAAGKLKKVTAEAETQRRDDDARTRAAEAANLGPRPEDTTSLAFEIYNLKLEQQLQKDAASSRTIGATPADELMYAAADDTALSSIDSEIGDLELLAQLYDAVAAAHVGVDGLLDRLKHDDSDAQDIVALVGGVPFFKKAVALHRIREAKRAAAPVGDGDTRAAGDIRVAFLQRVMTTPRTRLENMQALTDVELNEDAHARFLLFVGVLVDLVTRYGDNFPRNYQRVPEAFVNVVVAVMGKVGVEDIGPGTIIAAVDAIERQSPNALLRAFFQTATDAGATEVEWEGSGLNMGSYVDKIPAEDIAKLRGLTFDFWAREGGLLDTDPADDTE
jgi:hypothetical protein